jgi:ribosomal protein L20
VGEFNAMLANVNNNATAAHEQAQTAELSRNQAQAAATPAGGFEHSLARQVVDDLHQMIFRDTMLLGLSYSRLIDAMKKANVGLDRKVLATLAKDHSEVFARVVDSVKA